MISEHAADGSGEGRSGAASRRWIELVAPDDLEIQAAAQAAGVDEKLLRHALDLHERPRIEVDDDCTLLIIRAPHVEERDGDTRHSTVPVGILLTPSAVVLVCRIRDERLEDILGMGRSSPPDGRQLQGCICTVIKEVALLLMRYLKDISARIQEVERELERDLSNEDLKTLLDLQKSVTYFHAALKTNDFIIDRILRRGLALGKRVKLAFDEDERDVLDDALTDTRQGIYMSKIFTEVLNSISNVYASIISNSVNQIMKVLTSFTVILMVPTLVTSMYGMNIDLPFQTHAQAFAVVAGATALLTTAIVLALKIRRML